MLRAHAPAKVNLFLRVTGRRSDGYHLLDSLAVFPGAADVLHASPAEDLSLQVDGRFAAGLAGENLVLRAARALAAAAGVPAQARLVLEKNLPVSSGIGGGSADAAACLRLLSDLWGLDLARAELQAIALKLGADVPVCLRSGPARMGGIGEMLGPAPGLPPCGMVLVNPGQAISTPDVFRTRNPGFSEPAALPECWPDALAMAADLSRLGNDLQAPAITLCPAVAEVLAWLRTQPGCLLAQMSGSGATCYGLFGTDREAEAAAAGVPGSWWGWGGAMRTSAGDFTEPSRTAYSGPGHWGVAKR